MTELTLTQTPESEEHLPDIKTAGRVLFCVLGPCESGVYKYDIEVLCYETDGATFWINEGMGFDYWFDQYLKEDLDPGAYVVEGITGSWHHDSYYNEADEEYEHERVRRATTREIESQDFDD